MESAKNLVLEDLLAAIRVSGDPLLAGWATDALWAFARSEQDGMRYLRSMRASHYVPAAGLAHSLAGRLALSLDPPHGSRLSGRH